MKNERDAKAFGLACEILTAADFLLARASTYTGESTASEYSMDLLSRIEGIRDTLSATIVKATNLRHIAEGYDKP